MSEQRLSRLQKWILVEAYKHERHGEGYFGKWVDWQISKWEIYERFFNLRIRSVDWSGYRPGQGRAIRAFKFEDPAAGKKKAVILSRSLNKLLERDYIRNAYSEKNGTELKLTDKGVEMAKSIIARTSQRDYTITEARQGSGV